MQIDRAGRITRVTCVFLEHIHIQFWSWYDAVFAFVCVARRGLRGLIEWIVGLWKHWGGTEASLCCFGTSCNNVAAVEEGGWYVES